MMQVNGSTLVKWLDEAAERLKEQTQTALRLTSEASIIYAKTSKLYTRRSGKLAGSLRANVSSAKARVSADGGHAHYLENGTRPHQIVAKHAKVLRFVMNGEVVFRRRVFHPGTAPRPFMKEAQEQATPLFSRLVIEAVRSAFNR